jgi:hypothetical protein
LPSRVLPESARLVRSASEPATLDFIQIQMCFDGNLVVVQRLLDDGADPNTVERNEVEGSDNNFPPHCGLGRTALYLACRQGHLKVARVLLDRSADFEKTDSIGANPLYDGGKAPLHLACEKAISTW